MLASYVALEAHAGYVPAATASRAARPRCFAYASVHPEHANVRSGRFSDYSAARAALTR